MPYFFERDGSGLQRRSGVFFRPTSSRPMPAILRENVERGSGGFANLTLASSERIFISLAVSGLRVHRMLLGGLLSVLTRAALAAADAPSFVRLLERAANTPWAEA